MSEGLREGRASSTGTTPIAAREHQAVEPSDDSIARMVFVKSARDLKFIRVNSTAQKLLGLSEPELIGKTDRDIFPPGEAARIQRDDWTVLDAGNVGPVFEESLITRFGRRWFWTQKVPVPGIDGRPDLLLTFSEDVTEQRGLRTASQMWEQVFHDAERGIVVGTPDGTTLDLMNPAFARMHGYTVEELAGTPLLDIFAPEARRAVPAMLELVRRDGQHTFESFHLRKNGTAFPVLVDATAVKDAQGNVQYRALNVQDISQLKSAERGLRADRAEAERANEAKSQFLSRMSHELRTPLNVILGFAQVMQLDDLTPSQSENVDHILQAGRDLLALIDDVLDISRVESGKMALSVESVGVAEMAEEVLRLMRPLADRHGVRVAQTTPECDYRVFADRQRLKQVLLNLVSNGIKYNVRGGYLTVECVATESEVSISVSDTGVGIPNDSVERLFAPFERLGKEGTQIEGTGLGLSISKSLVEAMGGTISAARRAQQGSVFTVHLKRSQLPQGDPAPAATNAESSGGATGLVLYIEDNLASFQLVEKVLSQRPGVKVLPAMQAGIGLQLAQDYQPDLILLDLHLPDMTGEEVLQQLRHNPQTWSIPVVVASADATSRRLERLLELGAKVYLTKPIDVRELLDTIDRFLPDALTPQNPGT